MLIKRVYEVDPLSCPERGGAMAVVASIEPPQRDVIEKIPCGHQRNDEGSDRNVHVSSGKILGIMWMNKVIGKKGTDAATGKLVDEIQSSTNGPDLCASERQSRQFTQIAALGPDENTIVVTGRLSSDTDDSFTGYTVAAHSPDSGQTLYVESLPAKPVCLAVMLNADEQIHVATDNGNVVGSA